MLELAERVARVADELGIRTALIGAMALAAHNYVRGTADVDLATHVDPGRELRRLQQKLEALGLRAQLNLPDDDDLLGGLLRVWESDDDEGDPLNPVDVVNFFNPHRPSALNPGADAIREALAFDAASTLRYVRLPELVALKLYAGSRRDQADVVELLARNPDADLEETRRVCHRFGFDAKLEELIAEASADLR